MLVWLQEKYKGKQSERGSTSAAAPAPASAAPAPVAADPAIVASLESQVAQQGDKLAKVVNKRNGFASVKNVKNRRNSAIIVVNVEKRVIRKLLAKKTRWGWSCHGGWFSG